MKKKWTDWDPHVAVSFVAEFEQGPNGGPALTPYRCPAGALTIGFGHTRGVRVGDSLTREQAYDLLREDLAKFQLELAPYIKAPLTEGQFIAVLSWIFNLGVNAETLNSKFLEKLNSGDLLGAANELPRWKKSGKKVLPGLVTRRGREKELFLRDIK